MTNEKYRANKVAILKHNKENWALGVTMKERVVKENEERLSKELSEHRVTIFDACNVEGEVL